MRRSRRWRWVAVGAVVLLGLSFALDVVFVQYLESRGAAEIARSMAAEDVEVDLGGFPFFPRFARGRLSNVSAKVRGASASGGLRVQSVQATAEGLSFDAGELYSLARSVYSTRSDVTASKPIVIVELGEGDIRDYIRRHIPTVGDVQVKASGIEVSFIRDGVDPSDAINPSPDALTEPARLLPTTRDRLFRLILTSFRAVPPSFRADAQRLEGLIQLPKFPEGLDPEVSMRAGVIVLEAQGGESVTVAVGEDFEEDELNPSGSPAPSGAPAP